MSRKLLIITSVLAAMFCVTLGSSTAEAGRFYGGYRGGWRGGYYGGYRAYRPRFNYGYGYGGGYYRPRAGVYYYY
ncbi:MAG: hypothetical protein V4719_14120 [Planctomycetota bacterium]